MSVDDLDPSRRDTRLPRKGDKVVAAPNGPGCIEGVVVSYVAQRVTIRTEGKHGLVHPEFSRFTWNARRRVWVCWPLDVVREVRNWDRLDDRLMRPNLGIAQIGDYVVLAGIGGGWVVKQVGNAAPITGAGAIFQKLKSYVIATAKGRVEVDAGNLSYNSETRIWSGRANA